MIGLIKKHLIQPVRGCIEKAWKWFCGSDTAIFFTCTVILPIVGFATAGPSGPPFSQLFSFVFSIIGPFLFIMICIYAVMIAMAVIYALLS